MAVWQAHQYYRTTTLNTRFLHNRIFLLGSRNIHAVYISSL